MKVIVFAGTEKCDFCYYVSKILAKSREKVVVIDNSNSKELFTAMRHIEDDNEDLYIAKRSETVYLKDIDYSPKFFEAFDYVIIYMGMAIDYALIKESDVSFMMPDYHPRSLEAMKGIDTDGMEFILRDKAGKLTDKAAAFMMEKNPAQIAGALSFDVHDYACYLALLYNGRQSLAGLSGEYIDALAYAISKITGTTTKKAMAMVKKARK